MPHKLASEYELYVGDSSEDSQENPHADSGTFEMHYTEKFTIELASVGSLRLAPINKGYSLSYIVVLQCL